MYHKRLNTESLTVISATYTAESEMLEVEISNGKIRIYSNVPVYKYERLMTSRHKGKYFNKCIRNQFPFMEKDKI